jgi:RNase P/RNase MRP subunit p30
VDAKGRNVVYIKGGNIHYTRYATPDVIRIINALQLSKTGTKILKMAISSDIRVHLSLSKKTSNRQR